MMKDEILESLLFHKTIQGYIYESLDEEGNPGSSANRNTERLKIVFNDGRILIIDTFCSGSAQDTTMTFSKE